MDNVSVSSVRYRSAAERIGRSQRTVERLVRDQILKTVGSGQARRVTVESIEKYLKTHGQTFRDKTGDIRCTVSAVLDYQERVRKRIRKVQPLNSPSEAAALLGRPSDEIEKLVADGNIPSLEIGPVRFVTQSWLVKTLARAGGLDPVTV